MLPEKEKIIEAEQADVGFDGSRGGLVWALKHAVCLKRGELGNRIIA